MQLNYGYHLILKNISGTIATSIIIISINIMDSFVGISILLIEIGLHCFILFIFNLLLRRIKCAFSERSYPWSYQISLGYHARNNRKQKIPDKPAKKIPNVP
jgi:hypothetical protein